MKTIKDILKGMVIGIANIIPGVSGGTMMVAMGIYDKLIHCITHIFKEFKKSVMFLLPIAIGMVIAVVGSSFGIEMLFAKFPMQTNLLFVGLVIGGLPAVWKKVKGKSIRLGHLLVFLVFLAGFSSATITSSFGSALGAAFFFAGAFFAPVFVVFFSAMTVTPVPVRFVLYTLN